MARYKLVAFSNAAAGRDDRAPHAGDAQLALALAEGETLAKASEELGVALQTVRTYSKQGSHPPSDRTGAHAANEHAYPRLMAVTRSLEHSAFFRGARLGVQALFAQDFHDGAGRAGHRREAYVG